MEGGWDQRQFLQAISFLFVLLFIFFFKYKWIGCVEHFSCPSTENSNSIHTNIYVPWCCIYHAMLCTRFFWLVKLSWVLVVVTICKINTQQLKDVLALLLFELWELLPMCFSVTYIIMWYKTLTVTGIMLFQCVKKLTQRVTLSCPNKWIYIKHLLDFTLT